MHSRGVFETEPAVRSVIIAGGSIRDMAQFGSAPLWGSGGRRFKSGCPDSLGLY